MVSMNVQSHPVLSVRPAAVRKPVAAPVMFGAENLPAQPVKRASRLVKMLAVPALVLGMLTGCPGSKELKDIKQQYSQTSSTVEKQELLKKGADSQERDVRAWMVEQTVNLSISTEDKIALLEPRLQDSDDGVRNAALKALVTRVDAPFEKKYLYVHKAIDQKRDWALDALVQLPMPAPMKMVELEVAYQKGYTGALKILATDQNISAEKRMSYIHKGLETKQSWAMDTLLKSNATPDQKLAELEFAYTAGYDKKQVFDAVVALPTEKPARKIPVILLAMLESDPTLQEAGLANLKLMKDNQAVPFSLRATIRTVIEQRPFSKTEVLDVKASDVLKTDEKVNVDPNAKDKPKPGFVRVKRTTTQNAGKDFKAAIESLATESRK